MKRIVAIIGFVLLVIFHHFTWADTGNLFAITGSGLVATLDITLCLNGKAPLSCQNNTVTRQTLSIRTVTPNHTYPSVGIKIKTPDYTLSGCALSSNGYCLFSASNTTSASITVTSTSAPITLTSITPSSGTAAGGTGFTLTGTNLTGATGITLGGTAATSVNVVNSTTVTGVTPAHAAGAVDVVITVPQGTVTLTNGYTYLATAVGQSSGGGVIACLNGGLNNLIAATADNSAGIAWGGSGTTTNATSTTDGATNTTTIVNTLGAGITYAAGLCDAYTVDSQGNSPCQAGNTCYNDWFLPAVNNVTPTGQLNCLFINKTAIGGFSTTLPAVLYWSSTEVDANLAWYQSFIGGGNVDNGGKVSPLRVRCVRTFTP